jgi:hypothetical protein
MRISKNAADLICAALVFVLATTAMFYADKATRVEELLFMEKQHAAAMETTVFKLRDRHNQMAETLQRRCMGFQTYAARR